MHDYSVISEHLNFLNYIVILVTISHVITFKVPVVHTVTVVKLVSACFCVVKISSWIF